MRNEKAALCTHKITIEEQMQFQKNTIEKARLGQKRPFFFNFGHVMVGIVEGEPSSAPS